MTIGDEDAVLQQFGYRQRLDRSVSRLASFCIGFSVISATTAVFSGFGYGLTTGGPAFVWTFPLAAAIFFVWALIAGDLASRFPLSGYAYQWTSRLVGPSLGWFTGFAGLVGFISGFTGVAYIMASYLGGLFGWNLSPAQEIYLTITIVVVCVLINVYGVRLATLLNNIGVGLELVVTLGATLFVLIVALFVSHDHQGLSFLFSRRGAGGSSLYVWTWLTSSLGCIFGLLGVEASADVAEETVNARRVIPRTMLYALGTASAIEFVMYLVFLVAIKNPDAITASASPIADIMTAQVSSWFAKAVVAVALTNILVCVLANMLVATRLMYSISRDNVIPFSGLLSRVTAKHRSPATAVVSTGVIAVAILTSALFNQTAFAYIIGLSSMGYFTVYVLTTAGLIWADRRHPLTPAEPGTFDLGRVRRPIHVVGLVAFAAVLAALLLLPDFRKNGLVFVGVMAAAGLWWLFGLRPRLAKGTAGSAFALRNHGVGATPAAAGSPATPAEPALPRTP